jgi:quaternary ammonium compound-resistance protein SugE
VTVAAAWLLVIVAGLSETGLAVLLKQSHGTTRLWPTAGFAICALISFALLTVALKKLEVAGVIGVDRAQRRGHRRRGHVGVGESVSAMKLARRSDRDTHTSRRPGSAAWWMSWGNTRPVRRLADTRE